MRRLVLVSVAAIALVAAMIGIAWSSAPQRGTVATAARPEVHKVLFREHGGYATCGITCDSGGKTVTFAMPGHGDYRADITVTFQYQTSHVKNARASFQVGKVRPKSMSGDKDVAVKPNVYRLAVAPRNTSVTLQFVVPLRGGNKYHVTPIMLGRPVKQGARWSAASEKVVYSIDASPVS